MIATLTLAAALAVPSPVGPETRYDPRIPTLKQVTGHELGEEISSPDEIGAYLAALAAAAPDRARVVEYARSEEGRPLRVLVLGSPERLARLDDVQRQLRALADPRSLSPAEADRLVRELPAVVWLLHAVHGNEISSSGRGARAGPPPARRARTTRAPTSCGARRSCSSTPSRTRTVARASWPRTPWAAPPAPTPSPPPPSTTSRGRAAAGTTTSST